VIAAVALVGLLLGARAAHLSVSDGRGDLAFAAETSAGATEATVRGRGDILSADGRKLATSHATVRVIATPYQIQEPAEAAEALARVIGPETDQTADDIETLLTKRGPDGQPSGYSVVASGVDPRTSEDIWDLSLDGITVAPDAVRVYPEGTLASQLTGHLGKYEEAFGGVEARYDETLKSGEDVTLTLDVAVQQELEKALVESVEKNKANSALGVVLRVEDGAVVALANVPSYDNNRFEEASIESQRDRVLTDPYEPGSTFKAFTVASALEEGAVTPESRYVVPDSMLVADRMIHDSRPHETKIMRPADILRESSNVGAIQVAQDLGGEQLNEYIHRFGFGKPTGVDLWGENPGVVPAYEDWSGSSIGNIPIGQGLSVTPLQLVSGYAAIANGGQRITPHVVRREEPEPPGPRVISEKTSAIVRGMLQGVVEDGSGYKAQIPGYSVAGKTGTSQTVDPETGTYGDEYVASFIGFAPATDPEYVALIAVDDPRTTYWGELAAAPAFHEVMGFTLGYFNVPPDIETSKDEAR
jgi:cell division protein FtsI/penicillin-binding protein 2